MGLVRLPVFLADGLLVLCSLYLSQYAVAVGKVELGAFIMGFLNPLVPF